MSTLSVQVGKRIKELREAKKLKQVQLAELIDMEATNLSKLEKGLHLPKEENLKKIEEYIEKIAGLAAGCGLSKEELIDIFRINLEE